MIGGRIPGGVSAGADGEAEFCITREVKTIWDVTEQGMCFLVSVPNGNTENMTREQQFPTVFHILIWYIDKICIIIIIVNNNNMRL